MTVRHSFIPRYQETDQQGVVFNMWYLGYFSDASETFFEALGHPLPDLIAGGVGLQLVRTEVEWTGSLLWGEPAQVDVSCERVGTTSLTLLFEVSADGPPVARARSVYVLVAGDGAGKREIPPNLRAALTGA